MLPYTCIYNALCGCISNPNIIGYYCIPSENCCKVWNTASVTTTSQIYLALSHWEPWAEEWKTSYTQSRQLSSHVQHKLTRLVLKRIWVQIPAKPYIFCQSCSPTSLFISAYCPIVTPSLWKKKLKVHWVWFSVSTIQLPLQLQPSN